MKTNPLLSIISVHLNDFKGLNQTIQSLAPFLSDKDIIEWILVDGGSVISSNEDADIMMLAKSHAKHLISERDDGIYDAMNKGVKLATGSYLLFVNAGDILHPELDLDSLAGYLEKFPDMVWGECEEETSAGERIRIRTRTPAWAWYRLPVHHCATVYRASILPDPAFDTSYKIAADYDLLLKILKNHPVKISYFHQPISIFRQGGVSSTLRALALCESEELRTKYFRFGRPGNRLITLIQNFFHTLSKIVVLRKLWRSRV